MLRLVIFHPSRSGNVRMVNIVDRPDNRCGAQYQIKAKKNQVYSCRQVLQNDSTVVYVSVVVSVVVDVVVVAAVDVVDAVVVSFLFSLRRRLSPQESSEGRKGRVAIPKDEND